MLYEFVFLREFVKQNKANPYERKTQMVKVRYGHT
jgi:hypothetical protein